jgi:hypothetical protein
MNTLKDKEMSSKIRLLQKKGGVNGKSDSNLLIRKKKRMVVFYTLYMLILAHKVVTPFIVVKNNRKSDSSEIEYKAGKPYIDGKNTYYQSIKFVSHKHYPKLLSGWTTNTIWKLIAYINIESNFSESDQRDIDINEKLQRTTEIQDLYARNFVTHYYNGYQKIFSRPMGISKKNDINLWLMSNQKILKENRGILWGIDLLPIVENQKF